MKGTGSILGDPDRAGGGRVSAGQGHNGGGEISFADHELVCTGTEIGEYGQGRPSAKGPRHPTQTGDRPDRGGRRPCPG